MAGFTTVDTSTFDSAIAAFARALTGYKDARDLMSRKTDSLSDYWFGVGGDKFRAVMKGINQGLTDDCESLEHIIAELVTIKQAYLDADTEMKKVIEAN